MTDTRSNLLGLDQQALMSFFAELGEKPFRARQVLQWIHQRHVSDFSAMTDLSKSLRAKLEACAEVRAPEVIQRQHSNDGTEKWLIGLSCGNQVESVFIPEKDRNTLCVSSQVGCPLACSFCATGDQGLNRNLSAAEIIAQLWLVSAVHPIRNIVLMGMGEPLLNLKAVLPATHLMMDDLAYGLSKRRVTLSTSGIVPALDRLAGTSEVSLAVSLHAPNDKLRDELVPINQKYPIQVLLAACRRFVANDARRRVTFEYVMLDQVNDRLEHARALAVLLRDFPAKINLIPFNPYPGARYERSSATAIARFQDCLVHAGITTMVRKTRGDDIDAACGQLVGKVEQRHRFSASKNASVQVQIPQSAAL